MSGLCAFLKAVLPFLFFLFADGAVAQTQAKKTPTPKSMTAVIVGESPYVFSEANFDSDILAELPRGKRFTISRAKKGPFHRIRVKAGVMGWIADSEVRAVSGKVTDKNDSKTEEQLGDIFADSDDDISDLEENKEKRKKYLQWSRHMGLAIDSVRFTENTMGAERTESMTFFGFRLAGADTLFSGLVTADTHFMFSLNPPKYYETETGGKALGFVSLVHFQFLTQNQLTRDFIYHYGFGPMAKYSHYEISAGGSNYVLDDLNIGAVFGFGLAFRAGPVAFRPDFKYYWEKTKYWSLGLGILLEY